MNEKDSIDALAARFYRLFTNRDGFVPTVESIHDLFVPEGIIVRTCGEIPEIYTLAQFVEPRALILTNGELTDFEERETSERTSIVGYVAQRLSFYEKSGILRGERFRGRGVKMMQFICSRGTWKLCSVSWDDERPGFEMSELPP